MFLATLLSPPSLVTTFQDGQRDICGAVGVSGIEHRLSHLPEVASSPSSVLNGHCGLVPLLHGLPSIISCQSHVSSVKSLLLSCPL